MQRFARFSSGQRLNSSQQVQMKLNDSRFERAVGADTWPGRTLSTALGLPVLLFRPLWQTPFTPENCHIAEIILELPLRAFDVDAVVRYGSQSGFARIRIWHLFITDTSRPDSQRSGVTSHSHHNRKTPHPDFSLRL